jgi:hypothetical protein
MNELKAQNSFFKEYLPILVNKKYADRDNEMCFVEQQNSVSNILRSVGNHLSLPFMGMIKYDSRRMCS